MSHVDTRKNTCLLVAAMVAMGLLAAAAQGQVIRIRREVTLEPRQDVRLGDIATVTASDPKTAEALSNTIVLTSIDAARSIGAESILLALYSQRAAGMPGALQISGAAQCHITIASNQPATAAPTKTILAAPEVARSAALEMPTPATAPADHAADTLAGLIAARVRQELGGPEADVRVTFDTVSPLLDQTIGPGRKWLCRPLSRPLLGTVQFEAQLADGTRVVERLTVSTTIQRHITVVTLLARLARGDVVTPAMVHADQTWVDRSVPTLFATTRDVVGLEAQRDIPLGTMLDQRDFKPAIMAARGDPLTVIYLAGSLKVQMKGRAMTDGKLHDAIEVRNESTAERYQAVLIGKRLAVVGGILSEEDEKRLRETQ